MRKSALVLGLVLAMVGGGTLYASYAALSVPYQELVTVSYAETTHVPYTETTYRTYTETQNVPYTETQRVPYTEVQVVPKESVRTVPEQVIETKRGVLFSTDPFTLEAGKAAWQTARLRVGTDVTVRYEASDTVTVFVFNSGEYSKWMDGRSSHPEYQRKDASTGSFGVRIPVDETYYFVLYNEHTGFLGVGKKNVGILRFTSEAQWQETVTKVRTETAVTTATEVVTKTRTDTMTKTRTDTVTKTGTDTITKVRTDTLTKSRQEEVTRLRPETVISYYTPISTTIGQALGVSLLAVGFIASAVGIKQKPTLKPEEQRSLGSEPRQLICLKCGTNNPPGTKFCGQCASALA